jgi:hypothetical protein
MLFFDLQREALAKAALGFAAHRVTCILFSSFRLRILP